jgi:L,D-transpeptidase catalytic domain/FlgD Ig-like domain
LLWKYGRIAAAVLTLTVAGIATFLDRANQASFASTAPRAPLSAVVEGSSGIGLPNGAWAATAHLTFRVALSGGGEVRTAVAEIEVLPLTSPFSGVQNSAGKLVRLPAHGQIVVRIPISELRNGTMYHWRVRARGGDGIASPWMGSGVFGISITPPTTPGISSTNVPNSATTNIRTFSIHWSASTDRTGIAYYEWANSRNAQLEPTWHRTASTELHLHFLPSGTWAILVRAVNRAGVASAPLIRTVTIDRAAPSIEGLWATVRQLSVQSGPTHLRFYLSQAAQSTLVVYQTGHVTPAAEIKLGPLRAGLQDISWGGTDASGAYLPSGAYDLTLRAIDELGNASEQPLPGFTLDSRRIVVSLTKQELTAYDGGKILLHTLITSGGPETQTPVGTFHVMSKYSPYIMRSPWPKTSRLWYPDSPVSYAMLFQTGGYFLHDAPWRSAWGPGTNTVDGIPGGNTTGTHGCVNVPLAAERWLFAWAPIGTVVQILA